MKVYIVISEVIEPNNEFVGVLDVVGVYATQTKAQEQADRLNQMPDQLKQSWDRFVAATRGLDTNSRKYKTLQKSYCREQRDILQKWKAENWDDRVWEDIWHRVQEFDVVP